MLTPGEEWATDRRNHVASKREEGCVDLKDFLREENLDKNDLLLCGFVVNKIDGVPDAYGNIEVTQLGLQHLEPSSYFTIFVKANKRNELKRLLLAHRATSSKNSASSQPSELSNHLPWFVTCGLLAVVVYAWHDQFGGTPNTWYRELLLVFSGYYGLRFLFKGGVSGLRTQARKLFTGVLLLCALAVVSTIFSTCSSTNTPSCFGYRVGCVE